MEAPVTQFLRATLDGLLQGGLLALVAVGFSLVWAVLNVPNLAHGAFVLTGAYLALHLHETVGLDPFVAMAPCAAALFGVGYATQRLLVNPVVDGPVVVPLLVTFGLGLALVSLLRLLFTAGHRSIPTGYGARSFVLPGDVPVRYGQLIAAVVAVALSVALVAAVRGTPLAAGARPPGDQVRHVYAVAFGLAAAMAGAAGAAAGAVGTFAPADAGRFTLYGFAAAAVGGLGNLRGAVYGGLLLGLAQSWGGALLPASVVNAVALGAAVVVLALRPPRRPVVVRRPAVEVTVIRLRA
jgi:branched-chain amino acid transport system permease protein